MQRRTNGLEATYACATLSGLIRSGLSLLVARRVRPRGRPLYRRLFISNLFNYLLFGLLIVIPGAVLEGYQRLRTALTGKPRRFPEGAWQYYLQTGLREDPARYTGETDGYHRLRPAETTDLDDLTAWVMSVIQFLWTYHDLLGVVWDEWTMLRLVREAAAEAGLTHDPLFNRLQRQWEVERPYDVPPNGTYADTRHAAFDAFITPRLRALPTESYKHIQQTFQRLAGQERAAYQAQMSLLSTMRPRRFMEAKQRIPLWSAAVGVIVGGRYFTIDLVDRDTAGRPIIYGGRSGSPGVVDGAFSDNGYTVHGDQVYRADDAQPIGFLDMAPVSRVKGVLREVLAMAAAGANPGEAGAPVDVLLAETPRREQIRLRGMLPADTQASLEALARCPVIINWDWRESDRSLAELRQTQRGVGDHPLTIIRTANSFVFDHSHIFFDGSWSLAMDEVLTNAAVRWAERSISIAPGEPYQRPQPLTFDAGPEFRAAAEQVRRQPEVSAETVIWDISNIFTLRERLAETGTRLTVNDLLVITRILHAAHYEPSAEVQADVQRLAKGSRSGEVRRAVAAIDRSLERGRVLNPALLIPVDASPASPRQRIYPITFRNLADSLVWIWDDAWEAYQAYRRIEPPDTVEGVAAYRAFEARRVDLIDTLKDFSEILAANKRVAMRGESLNVAILRLLVGLPLWLQIALKQIPEYFLPLNEIIRGDEVYSNVGRVARGSSLTRFITAKDDGRTKALAWGVMSDDRGRMIVTMRDFRPHVRPLIAIRQMELAQRLAQDYVVTYTVDLIGLVARLSAMLQAEAPQPAGSHDTIGVE